MTPLSGAETYRCSVRHLRSLARRSLFLAAMSVSATACVDSPPTFTAPEHSPPFILADQVVPDTSRVFTMSSQSQTTTITFTVPFKSLDLDQETDKLRAVFWLDYDPNEPQSSWRLSGEVVVDGDTRPLSEQDNRVVSNPWKVPATNGACHRMTMWFAHTSEFPTVYQPTDTTSLATVTWFLDLHPSGQAACWTETVP